MRALRKTGVSYRAIGQAAGVSPMTVHRVLHGDPSGPRVPPERMHAREARCLLGVTAAQLERAAGRRSAAGTRLRLRALIAVGHPAASLAARAGLSRRAVWDIVAGTAQTISPELRAAVAALYEQLWDQPPEVRTAAQRRAVAAARGRAARQGWPPPMGLDDDRIDDPGYRPRTRCRPVDGGRRGR